MSGTSIIAQISMSLSFIFTINMVSTAENCKEKWIILLKDVGFFLLLIIIYALLISRQLIFNINVVVLIVLFC